MTEHKWLGLAGLLNTCSYGLINPNCPFLELQQLDQYQRLEWLINIDEREAEKLLDCCKEHRKFCVASAKQPTLKSLELQLIP
jgi:hypothetical protein